MKAKQPDPFFDPTKTYTHIVFGYEVKFIGYKKREPIYKVIKPGGHTFIGETFTTNEPQKFFTINKETQAQQTAGKWNVTTIRSNGGGDYPGIMNDKQIITSCSTGTKEEAEANAAYIVKCCNSHDELLQACWLALTRLESGTDKDIAFNKGIADKLREVIQKAEQ